MGRLRRSITPAHVSTYFSDPQSLVISLRRSFSYLHGVCATIPPTQAPCTPALAHTSSLDTDLTRNTRASHFTPQHWLLCHMGLY